MPFMVDYSADIQISECMNDIINQVETREWNRMNEHRDRLVKKMKKQKATIEEMKDDWEVATEKIAQENCDLHKEVKALESYNKQIKNSNQDTCSYWSNKVKELEKENKDMKKENEKYKLGLMNSSGSFKCEKCNIHLTEYDVYRSVDDCEGKLLCESCCDE